MEPAPHGTRQSVAIRRRAVSQLSLRIRDGTVCSACPQGGSRARTWGTPRPRWCRRSRPVPDPRTALAPRPLSLSPAPCPLRAHAHNARLPALARSQRKRSWAESARVIESRLAPFGQEPARELWAGLMVMPEVEQASLARRRQCRQPRDHGRRLPTRLCLEQEIEPLLELVEGQPPLGNVLVEDRRDLIPIRVADQQSLRTRVVLTASSHARSRGCAKPLLRAGPTPIIGSAARWIRAVRSQRGGSAGPVGAAPRSRRHGPLSVVGLFVGVALTDLRGSSGSNRPPPASPRDRLRVKTKRCYRACWRGAAGRLRHDRMSNFAVSAAHERNARRTASSRETCAWRRMQGRRGGDGHDMLGHNPTAGQSSSSSSASRRSGTCSCRRT